MSGVIGRLRRNLALLARVTEVDDAGVARTVFQPVAKIFAATITRRSADGREAGADRAPAVIRMLIRRRRDIGVGWRIVEEDKTFTITALVEADDSRRFQVIEAREVLP